MRFFDTCTTDGSAKSVNCAARTMVPPLYGRLIGRWRHGKWCHLCGKGLCFHSTRGPTGSLLVDYWDSSGRCKQMIYSVCWPLEWHMDQFHLIRYSSTQYVWFQKSLSLFSPVCLCQKWCLSSATLLAAASYQMYLWCIFPSLSWLSTASFSGYHSLHYCLH